MDKISPLRAGLNAINNKLKLNKTDKVNNAAQNSTNPFGISLKGTLLQMDVFESKAKQSVDKIEKAAKVEKFEKTAADNIIKADSAVKNPVVEETLAPLKQNSNPFMEKVNGFVAGAKELGNNIKQNTISFCGKVKDTFQKIKNTEVSMDLFGNSVKKLSKRPVNDLENMFKSEAARV